MKLVIPFLVILNLSTTLGLKCITCSHRDSGNGGQDGADCIAGTSQKSANCTANQEACFITVATRNNRFTGTERGCHDKRCGCSAGGSVNNNGPNSHHKQTCCCDADDCNTRRGFKQNGLYDHENPTSNVTDLPCYFNDTCPTTTKPSCSWTIFPNFPISVTCAILSTLGFSIYYG